MEKLGNSCKTKMNKYCVYIHTNKINGKRYIGITSTKPELRWRHGDGYYKNKHFRDAIQKYGWDNFAHEIVFNGLSKEDACAIEKKLIQDYKTQDKRHGYNLTDGGETFHHSQDSKQLMSERRKGKGRVKRTPEQIERMKMNHAGGNDKKPVLCLETGILYESINDASGKTNINKKQISGCCRKLLHYNTAGGLHWKFANED